MKKYEYMQYYEIVKALKLLIAFRGTRSATRLIAILVCSVLILACGESVQRNHETSVDCEIFDMVFTDLITKRDLPVGVLRSKNRTIIVDGSGRPYRISSSDMRYPFDPKIPKDVVDDVKRRMTEPYSIEHYTPNNPDIVVRRLTGEGIDATARAYVKPSLPGYSKDGKTAYLYFAIGPSEEHPAWGYYLLRKTDGKWTIVERYIGLML